MLRRLPWLLKRPRRARATLRLLLIVTRLLLVRLAMMQNRRPSSWQRIFRRSRQPQGTHRALWMRAWGPRRPAPRQRVVQRIPVRLRAILRRRPLRRVSTPMTPQRLGTRPRLLARVRKPRMLGLRLRGTRPSRLLTRRGFTLETRTMTGCSLRMLRPAPGIMLWPRQRTLRGPRMLLL